MIGRSEIKRVFKDCRHPGNQHLLRSDDTDESDVNFLCQYEGKGWWDIDSEVLVVEGSCLSALSDPGLSYVIPAYLVEFSKEDHEDTNGWVDRLLLVLAEKGRGNLQFSRPQATIINEVFLAKMYDCWMRHGVLGSNLGHEIERLVATARSNYCSE